jgi:hypothetical protein
MRTAPTPTYQDPLADTAAAKGLSHKEVLKEQTRTYPSGITGKQERETSRLCILLCNDRAEFRVRTKAVTPQFFRDEHRLGFVLILREFLNKCS